jgi:hypothetical protein
MTQPRTNTQLENPNAIKIVSARSFSSLWGDPILTGKKPSARKPGLSEVERRLRVMSLLPTQLSYDPFESTSNMKKLLADLVRLVLLKKIHHRTASCVRSLVHEYMAVDEHERLDKIEERIRVLEEVKQH